MQFEFATAGRVVFRRGAASDLPRLAREFGSRALIVTGRSQARAEWLRGKFEEADISCSFFSVECEPTLEAVREGVRAARQGFEVVIGFGGGSAIDAAKAIAILATNSGEPLDYLEVIGKGRQFEKAGLPFLAVPTTAGTGAEVTRNAVLGSPEHHVKASLRGAMLLPKIALIDPELTFDVPPAVTASTGLDTLTQLIEPYVSVRANAFTDQFCVAGLPRVAKSLPVAFQNGYDSNARQSMAFASLLSGLALANAGLGVVHGFAAPLGGMLNAPHGALCAALLPHSITVNLRVLREREPQNPALERYREVAQLLTGRSNASPEDGAAWVSDLCRELGTAPLGTYGLNCSCIPALVEKAARANSMKANPIVLTPEELAEIAERAL